MAYRSKKSAIAVKKGDQNPSSYYSLFMGGTVLSGLLLAFLSAIWLLNRPAGHPVYGQYPTAGLSTITPESDSGQDLNPTASDTPDQAIKAERYGIAAGGVLAYRDQAQLDEYFASLRSLGVSWVRWDIDWSLIMKDGQTEYQWTETDRIADTANKYGLQSLAIITYAPRWAASPSCSESQRCAPADAGEFGRFAGESAKRYGSSVRYWEIWNEPNLSYAWGPEASALKYAAALKAAYTAIKQIDPSAVVIAGGLSYTKNSRNGNIVPLEFIRSLYSAKAGKYFDAIAIHPYTFPDSPGTQSADNGWLEIPEIHKIMAANGDADKKIWITEYGAPTGGPGEAKSADQPGKFNYGSDHMREDGQSDLMADAVNLTFFYADYLGPFFWYNLRDGDNGQDDPENFFGLLRADGTEKPAYEVFKNAIAGGS